MQKEINICLSCDDNYSKHAGVTISSILSNANTDDILHFYILDGGITEKHIEEILSLKTIKNFEISFLKIDETLFDDFKKIKTHRYITLPAYFRLKLPSILPNIDKIIYLDCDTIVKTSLSELYNIDLKEHLLAGVIDINDFKYKYNKKPFPNYINSGVILFNLKKMRKERIEEKFFNHCINNINSIDMGDQQIINEVCINDIKVLDELWNVQTLDFIYRSNFTKSPKIIHFIGEEKPWMLGCRSYFRKEYFKYLQKTVWKYNRVEMFKWTFVNEILSLIKFTKHRPFFIFQKKFHKAFINTYIK